MIIHFDGHMSRLTTRVRDICIANNIVPVLIPSHTSMIHQAADCGVQAMTQTLYERAVMRSVCDVVVSLRSQLRVRVLTNPLQPIKTTDIFSCLFKTVIELAKKTDVLRAAFTKVGIVNGAIDATSFTTKTYKVGASFRDPSMPAVTPQLLQQVCACTCTHLCVITVDATA